MQLNDKDYKLSMRISPRSQQDEVEEEETRSLLIHRLRSAIKAVLRLGLRNRLEAPRRYGLYCEDCGRWSPAVELSEEISCPHCGQTFVAELVVYSSTMEKEMID